MRLQRTVAREVELAGVGLHRGVSTRLRIAPAPPDTGLVFVRDDLGGLEIPALQQYRVPMVNASRLRRGEATVETPRAPARGPLLPGDRQCAAAHGQR
ncbi:MAG: UDP-3-O-acyl-N-acetylglucosamine deacetylase [Acidobacteriota bacterium]|nr:UDP-3-O-acyl-N-acetylglucosamine deacetylase [Acidobacteriota bacterium]